MKWIALLFLLFIYSCSSEIKNENNTSLDTKTDTTELIRSFIYGLWSMDSQNVLNNEGFYFKPDGSVDFIAAEVSGSWELKGRDSIKIIYSSYNEELSSDYKIDSITEGRMVLVDADGRYLLRKVPFGMNNEGTILRGFAGTLEKGDVKEYLIDIPSVKKIELKLISENNDIAFNIFDGEKMITPAPVRTWTAIMIRGGKYRAQVFNKKAGDKKPANFDLKLIMF